MRVRCGGSIVQFSLSQVWALSFVILFLLSAFFLISNSQIPTDDSDGDKKYQRDVIEIKDYELDPNRKSVQVDRVPLEAPKQLLDKVPGLNSWPKNMVNSWRLEDYKLREGIHKGWDDKVVMAMDEAKQRKDYILTTQNEIIRNHKRAPDSRYNINVTLSDMTSMDRSIPDTRPEICKHMLYDYKNLPKASVIIPFYNEALTMLLRTVHSVLNRTPDSLLEEIILVDDKSTDPWLRENIDIYMKLLPKVKIIRNKQRMGLIVSRMRGAKRARAPVLIFQDAHTEANVGWLPPLLDEIKRHPRAVYQPFVDNIDTMSLAYTPSQVFHKGAFSWDLRYTWIKVSDHEQQVAMETGQPFTTPTLVGCALAVDKEYFFSIGGFDEGLRVWGGENIELAFRVWQCGGKVTTVTCARVGHAFKEFPYTFDGNKEDIVHKNLIRVTETWMDGMRKYFYASTRVYDFKRAELNEEEQRSLAERIEVRKQLKCKNFEWYMHNIIPEVDIPPMNAVYYGEIMNQLTRACWEITEDYYLGMTYVCYGHKIIPKNNFALTTDGLLRYRDKCLKISPPNPQLTLAECPKPDEIDLFGRWEVESKGPVWGFLQVTKLSSEGVRERFCLVQVTNMMPAHYKEQMPQIDTCDHTNKYQEWIFTYHFDWDQVPKSALL